MRTPADHTSTSVSTSRTEGAEKPPFFTPLAAPPQAISQSPASSIVQRDPLAEKGDGTPVEPVSAEITAPPATKSLGWSSVYWLVDFEGGPTSVELRMEANFSELSQFLYAADHTEFLARKNGLPITMSLGIGTRIQVTGTGYPKASGKVLKAFRNSPWIPREILNPNTFLASMGVENPLDFHRLKKKYEKELETDFKRIGQMVTMTFHTPYSDKVVLDILKKWAEIRFIPYLSNYRRYPAGGYYLDAMFSKMIQKTLTVGWVVDQWTSYYSLMFNHFGNTDEIIALQRKYNSRHQKDRGIKEVSFSGTLWKMTKSGEVRDQIFGYFKGMGKAVVGLAEGLHTLVTDPVKVIEGIANLPKTVSTLWKNRSALWKQFVNASPEKQGEIIGRIFGETELLLASFGAGAGPTAATKPAVAVEVVAMSGGHAALRQTAALTMDLGKLGREGSRMIVLTAQMSSVTEEGNKQAASVSSSGTGPKGGAAKGVKAGLPAGGGKLTKQFSTQKLPYWVTGLQADFAAIRGTCVYILKDANGTVLYVGEGTTFNRLRAHIKDPKKSQWFGEIAQVEVRGTRLSKQQSLALEEDLIDLLKPLHNIDRQPYMKANPHGLRGIDLPPTEKTRKFNVSFIEPNPPKTP